jgi:hypothetical protein
VIYFEYGAPRQICILENKEIDESSGLACLEMQTLTFFTHNDDRNDTRLFAFDIKGKDLGTYNVSGAKAIDWEDLCSFKRDSNMFLLCADVGNNKKKRPILTLYILELPTQKDEIDIFNKIDFMFEDGPQNCEAVGVDSKSKEILLINKAEKNNSTKVYMISMFEEQNNKNIIAKVIAELKMKKVTSMDISPDCSRAVILANEDVYEFIRKGSEAWEKVFRRKSRNIAHLPQGKYEAICYGPDGKGLYITREKLPTPLLIIPRIENEK